MFLLLKSEHSVECVCAHPGLQILYTMLQNVAQEEAAAQSFYQTYFCDVLQHIFSVVTDTSHTAGEFAQAQPHQLTQQAHMKSEGRGLCVVNTRVSHRPDDACVHPGLHVQPGGGREDHHDTEPLHPRQQPGVHSGVRGQPAQDCLPSPARVSVNTHTHTQSLLPGNTR